MALGGKSHLLGLWCAEGLTVDNLVRGYMYASSLAGVETWAILQALRWAKAAGLKRLQVLTHSLEITSSSEKMKLELQKATDELKMSESDWIYPCSSGELTTKIKPRLYRRRTNTLRRVFKQWSKRRKKLLKYLRTTDWDSYCLVFSQLGLRDNPCFKILINLSQKKHLTIQQGSSSANYRTSVPFLHIVPKWCCGDGLSFWTVLWFELDIP